MELLTKSGWSSSKIIYLIFYLHIHKANDIESIIIQIRAEMADGGARYIFFEYYLKYII